jgi:hypothetical protein
MLASAVRFVQSSPTSSRAFSTYVKL